MLRYNYVDISKHFKNTFWRKQGMVKEKIIKKLAQNVERVAYKAGAMKCMGYFYEPEKPEALKKNVNTKIKL